MSAKLAERSTVTVVRSQRASTLLLGVATALAYVALFGLGVAWQDEREAAHRDAAATAAEVQSLRTEVTSTHQQLEWLRAAVVSPDNVAGDRSDLLLAQG